nr:hypothetical protein [uncultured bacterium]
MCLFRLSCGVYVAIVERTARPLKVKPVQHIPPVLRSRFRINDERPRARPYIGLSLANFLGFLSFFLGSCSCSTFPLNFSPLLWICIRHKNSPPSLGSAFGGLNISYGKSIIYP